MTTAIITLALLASPPDVRTVEGTINMGLAVDDPRQVVYSVIVPPDGTAYTLSFVDRPDIKSYIGRLGGKPAYVVGLYGETRLDADGRTDTIRTLRVLYVAEAVAPKKD